MKPYYLIIFTAFTCIVMISGCTASSKLLGEKNGITDAYIEMNHPEFWISTTNNPRTELMTREQIALFSSDIPKTEQSACVVLEAYPENLDKVTLLQAIQHKGMPAKQCYIGDITPDEEYYRILFLNRNEASVQEQNPVRWGVVEKNTMLRTWPTNDVSYEKANDIEFDQSCETVLKTGERVAVLHTSTDTQWLLVQAYNYSGWLPVSAVAFTDRPQWLRLGAAKDLLIVTANRIHLDHDTMTPEISARELTMGTKLPLVQDKPKTLNGISTASSYVVELPVRMKDGSLQMTQARIPESQDVSVGFLPYTAENIINQAFKMLGERYGWGGMWNARDCSSFTMDIYQCFGIDLPRNASEQTTVSGKRIDVSAMSDDEKKNSILRQSPGTLLEKKGHIALYLGNHNGEPYIIHQTYRFSPPENGDFENISSAVVSSLNVRVNTGDSFLKAIRMITPIAN